MDLILYPLIFFRKRNSLTFHGKNSSIYITLWKTPPYSCYYYKTVTHATNAKLLCYCYIKTYSSCLKVGQIAKNHNNISSKLIYQHLFPQVIHSILWKTNRFIQLVKLPALFHMHLSYLWVSVFPAFIVGHNIVLTNSRKLPKIISAGQCPPDNIRLASAGSFVGEILSHGEY